MKKLWIVLLLLMFLTTFAQAELPNIDYKEILMANNNIEPQVKAILLLLIEAVQENAILLVCDDELNKILNHKIRLIANDIEFMQKDTSSLQHQVGELESTIVTLLTRIESLENSQNQ